MDGWRRRSACFWMFGRVFVALAMPWVCGRLARLIDAGKSRAIEERGCALAPLLLFVVLSLLDDSTEQSERWVAPAQTQDVARSRCSRQRIPAHRAARQRLG
jgi:hypothetical protein